MEDTAGADAKMEREIDREMCNAGFVPDHYGEERAEPEGKAFRFTSQSTLQPSPLVLNFGQCP